MLAAGPGNVKAPDRIPVGDLLLITEASQVKSLPLVQIEHNEESGFPIGLYCRLAVPRIGGYAFAGNRTRVLLHASDLLGSGNTGSGWPHPFPLRAPVGFQVFRSGARRRGLRRRMAHRLSCLRLQVYLGCGAVDVGQSLSGGTAPHAVDGSSDFRLSLPLYSRAWPVAAERPGSSAVA